MKCNPWTVVLAAVGVVSQASLAKAEEQESPVLTALSSTTLSGYVDTSAQWNFGTGNANLPPYKFGGTSKADGFNLDIVQLRIDRPLDETEWAAGYRADLWFGPDANVLHTQSILTGGTPADFAIRQAYVKLRLPLKNGLDVKLGVFDSIVGYESVESPNDPNYTRSYSHTIEPQTHTGLLASYRFCEFFSASFGVANTMGPTINERAQGPNLSTTTEAESYKAYMGSFAITAPDSLGFLSGSTLYAGIVNGFSDLPVDRVAGTTGATETSYYVGTTLTTPWSRWRLGASFDYLDVHPLSGETWAVDVYSSLQLTEKLSLHARAEYLRDRGEQKFFETVGGLPTAPDEVLALTATAQYDLWQNVLSRLEFRWDHSLSGDGVWGADTLGAGTLKNEFLLAANVIYKF